MTRHQVWKARERARFRLMAEEARNIRDAQRPKKFHIARKALSDAYLAYFLAQREAAKHGIPKPFTG